jgi:hypothetical protein
MPDEFTFRLPKVQTEKGAEKAEALQATKNRKMWDRKIEDNCGFAAIFLSHIFLFFLFAWLVSSSSGNVS